MVAFFAGAAVAALATSNGARYDYNANNSRGFFKAPNAKLGEHNYGDHYEQRLNFGASSIRHLFKQRGKHYSDCSSTNATKTGYSYTNNAPCFVLLIMPDKKFTRPVTFQKQKLVRYTGDKTVGKWTYTFNSTEYNACLDWHSGLTFKRSSNMVDEYGSAGTWQGTIPMDADVSNFADVRNLPGGDPLFPSIFRRYRDPSTMYGYLVEKSSIQMAGDQLTDGEQQVVLNDMPYLTLVLKGCHYESSKEGRDLTNPTIIHGVTYPGSNPTASDFANSFNDATAGEAHRTAFLEAVPEELGFEYTSIIESETIDQLLGVDTPELTSGDSPSVFDIVSLSIGSVALAIGLGILVSMKCLGRITNRTTYNFM